MVRTTADEMGFNWRSDHRLDIDVLEGAVDVARAIPVEHITPHDILLLEEALVVYRADLMPGLHHDWVLRERERIRLVYLAGLAIAMYGHARADALERSVECGRVILRLDPLREDIHRAMMRLFMASGQRAQALKQYAECVRVLAEELQIGPMPETKALLTEIRRASGGAVSSAFSGMSDLERALDRLGVGSGMVPPSG